MFNKYKSMKMRNLFIAAMLLLAGSLTTEMMAQDAVTALVKKCESMKDVQIQKARSRDKDTKEVTRDITTIVISSNPSLVNDFISAFNKDRNNALEEAESLSEGKVSNLFLRFEKSSCSLTQTDGGSAVVSLTIGDNMRYFGSMNINVDPKINFNTDRVVVGRGTKDATTNTERVVVGRATKEAAKPK